LPLAQTIGLAQTLFTDFDKPVERDVSQGKKRAVIGMKVDWGWLLRPCHKSYPPHLYSGAYAVFVRFAYDIV
jgi:hypothetical protein